MRSFIAILILGGAPFITKALAEDCSLELQLSSYIPQSCHTRFIEGQCSDQCRTADPEFDKSCFSQLTLPCEVKQELMHSAPSAQRRGNIEWLHIADLLNDRAMTSNLHIIQSELFTDLYANYVQPPPYKGLSGGTLALKKQNFRLNRLDEITRVSQPLSESGAYKRLEFGKALETQLEAYRAGIISKVMHYPYFTAQEKGDLVNELNSLWNKRIQFWTFVKRVSPDAVGASRVNFLNGKLNKFVSNLNALPEAKKALLADKVAHLNHFSAGLIAQCGRNATDYCLTELVFDTHFYPNKDRQLTFLEAYLSLLENEVEALKFTYDEALHPTIPQTSDMPDFTGFLDKEFSMFRSEPTADALRRLEAAISIAFLQQGKTGEETFAELSKDAIPLHTNNSFLSRIDTKPILLCREYNQLDARLNEINRKVFTKANEARDVMNLMYEQGRTPYLMSRLQLLLQEVTTLTVDSQSITGIDRFTDDRQINIQWYPGASLDGSFNKEATQLSIVYAAFDGMFWIPSMSMQLNQLLPNIQNIYTTAGSLLPNGTGSIIGLNELSLSLRASPYTACAPENKQLKLIISLVDSQGNRQRYSLIAEIEQP